MNEVEEDRRRAPLGNDDQISGRAHGQGLGVVRCVGIGVAESSCEADAPPRIRGVGLLRSTDGGDTFERTGEGLEDANLVIADYSNPTSSPIQFSPAFADDGVVFAYAQQEVLRSDDRGSTWVPLELPSAEQLLASLEEVEPPPTTTSPADAAPATAGGVDGAGDEPTRGGVDQSDSDGVTALAALLAALLGILIGAGVAMVPAVRRSRWRVVAAVLAGVVASAIVVFVLAT